MLMVSYKPHTLDQVIFDFIDRDVLRLDSIFRDYFMVDNMISIVHLADNFNSKWFGNEFGFKNGRYIGRARRQ